MRFQKTSLLLTIALISGFAPAQSLPDQIYFSEDSTLLLAGGLLSQGFYDESMVRSINLEFYEPDFWQQMKDNYDTENFVLASLTYEGTQFDSVAVQFKGQTSFRKAEENGSEKLSFSIKLDEIIDGQDIEGYNNFNLNNAFQDASFMKEVLYARLSRDFMPGLKGNFVSLSLNGEDWGLYANIQQLNGDFIKEWFPDKAGIRWRADAPADAPSAISDPVNQPLSTQDLAETRPKWGNGTSALNYLGEEYSLYQKYYTLKNSEMDDPWAYLVKVCDVLNNTPLDLLKDSLSAYMDIDATLWFLAQEILFSDDDSYVHKGGMDYYLYLDRESGKLVPLEFDGNSAMNIRNVEWSPFMNTDSINYPLLNRLLALPELRQRYIAHAKTIIDQAFDVEGANALIDQYAALIDPYLQTDPKIDFSFQMHTRGVNNLRRYIETRRNYILLYPEFTEVAPTFTKVQQWVNGEAGAVPSIGEELVVTASVSHAEGISQVKLHYGSGIRGDLISVDMSDDGSGTDALAGDGIFTGSIPSFPSGTFVRYYVEARADNQALSVSYMPEGAEYDLFIYQVILEKSSDAPGLVINEFLASNDLIMKDESGEYDDWIELHNISDREIELAGFHLSDNSLNMTKWTFPEISIASGGYLVVWADDDEEQGPLHANFKLSSDGEELILSDTMGSVLDLVSFTAQEPDTSYGRLPNGSGAFFKMNPTFEAYNSQEISGGDPDVSTIQILIYPNPVKNLLSIETDIADQLSIEIISLGGQIIYRRTMDANSAQIDLSAYDPGIYIVTVSSNDFVKREKIIKL